jgi:putative endonuclease
MPYFVYIMASRRNGTLYIGVTSDLVRQAYEHREGLVGGFTKRYGVRLLVYYEIHEEVGAAIEREKNLKKWNRAWKVRAIEERNPDWIELYPSIASQIVPEAPPSNASARGATGGTRRDGSPPSRG